MNAVTRSRLERGRRQSVDNTASEFAGRYNIDNVSEYSEYTSCSQTSLGSGHQNSFRKSLNPTVIYDYSCSAAITLYLDLVAALATNMGCAHPPESVFPLKRNSMRSLHGNLSGKKCLQ